jgi:acetoin utilization deacetylase AcuC-like enzyme
MIDIVCMVDEYVGTDVLSGDPLGRMDVDMQSVVRRDEMVWRHALEVAKAPIVMVLSGGEESSWNLYICALIYGCGHFLPGHSVNELGHSCTEDA